jgi:protein transport protein SEC61 subunit alpha
VRPLLEVSSILFRFWIVISKSTPRDYAKYLRGQELTLRNYKEKSVFREMNEMIPVAAMLGGVAIGFLTVVGDLLNVAGSSTGIMLSITILYGYYEKMTQKEVIIDEF